MNSYPVWLTLVAHLQDTPDLVERGAGAGLPAYVFTALGTLVLVGSVVLWWLIRRSKR
ncbi:hypothetical protein PQI23_08335 [Leucobacter sp. USCH14]|uniref:hypothetical protein n=1 Tax=Leucobacter sp. USCH14 TaxID=3024838 RepID=UPI0030B74EDA